MAEEPAIKPLDIEGVPIRNLGAPPDMVGPIIPGALAKEVFVGPPGKEEKLHFDNSLPDEEIRRRVNSYWKQQQYVAPSTQMANIAESAIKGLPLVPESIVSPAMGRIGAIFNPVEGQSQDETAQQRTVAREKEQKKFEEREPFAAAGAGLLGGGLGLGAASKLPFIAKLLGVSPDLTTLQMMTRGAASTGATAAADTAIGGKGDPMTSGVVGGVLGGIVPGSAGYLGRKAGQFTGERLAQAETALFGKPWGMPESLRGSNPLAISMLQPVLQQGGLTSPTELKEAYKAAGGPSSRPFNYSEELAAAARAARGLSAPVSGGKGARGIVADTVKQQTKQTPEVAEGLLTKVLGPKEDMAELMNDLNNRKRAAGSLFKQFTSTEIPRTAELDALVPRLAAAGVYPRAKKYAGIEGKGFNPTQLTAQDYQTINSSLGDLINDSRGPLGQSTHETQLLTKLKHDLIDTIDNHPNKSIGQMWKQARDTFAEPASIQTAVRMGQNWRNMDRDELPEVLARMGEPQRRGFIQGVWKDIGEILDTRHGGNRVRDLLLTPIQLDKLASIPSVGSKGAEKLQAGAEQLLKQAETRGVAVGGSQTDTNLGTRQAFQPPESILRKAQHMYNPEVTAAAYAIPPPFIKSIESDLSEKYALARTDIARLLSLPGNKGLKVMQDLQSYPLPGSKLSEKARYGAYLAAMAEIMKKYPEIQSAGEKVMPSVNFQ